jgi:NAD(P)-dependent dehydrogenase (short-subunit alcohol dehydrogenase family)
VSGDRLAGKRTLITGAGSGLGRGAALRFAEEGAAVACVDRNGAAAKEVAEEIASAGGTAAAFEADVTDEESVAAMFAAAAEQLGGIDAGYANAGIQIVGEAADTPLDEWHKVIAVNLTGVFLTGKHAIKQMVSQGTGGSIINQASIAALFGSKAGAAYAAAKGGVVSMSRQMAVDYGAHGIRVNAVCPGTVWTPLVEATYEARAALYKVEAEVSRGATATRAPLGRLGEPVDIANMALFLASDDSSWVTGGTFVVDGGFTAA